MVLSRFLPEPVVLVIRNNGLESQHRLGFRCLLLMVGIGVPMLRLRVGPSTLTLGFQSRSDDLFPTAQMQFLSLTVLRSFALLMAGFDKIGYARVINVHA